MSVLLTTAAATASSPLATFAPVAATAALDGLIWLVGQPLLWAIVTPRLTELVKRLPFLDETNRGLVRGVAGVLGVATGFLASWATGDFSRFDFEAAARTLGEGITATLAAFALYDLRREAPKVATPVIEAPEPTP